MAIIKPEIEESRQGFYGWKIVGILFFVYLVINGIVFYGYNVAFPAMIKEMNWARGDASVAQTLRALVAGFSAPLSAYLIARWGSRLTILIGTGVGLVSLIALGTIANQLWQWTLCWGLGTGILFGLACTSPITTINNFWFSKRRGATMGIIFTGSGIGGALAQPGFVWAMGQTGSWRIAWLIAALFVFFAIVAALGIKTKPADIGQYPDGITPNQVAALKSGHRKARTYRTQETWTVKEALQTRPGYLLTVAYVVMSCSMFLVFSHGVLHLTDLGYQPAHAAYFLSIVVLLGGVAKFPMGWLVDYIEGRRVLMFLCALMGLSLAVIWKAPSMTALVAAGVGYGISYGATAVLIPTMFGNYYGAEAYPAVNGAFYPWQSGIGAIAPMGAGYIYDIFHSYDVAYMIMIGLTVCALVASFLATPPVKPEKLSDVSITPLP